MEKLILLWNIIEYPIYVLAVAGFIVWLYRSSKAPAEDEMDDPAGNSNIRKKWYDFT